jgi:hypothetical protein
MFPRRCRTYARDARMRDADARLRVITLTGLPRTAATQLHAGRRIMTSHRGVISRQKDLKDPYRRFTRLRRACARRGANNKAREYSRRCDNLGVSLDLSNLLRERIASVLRYIDRTSDAPMFPSRGALERAPGKERKCPGQRLFIRISSGV